MHLRLLLMHLPDYTADLRIVKVVGGFVVVLALLILPGNRPMEENIKLSFFKQ